ncbi:MAG: patatin-like phospholipase family protein [Acidobacteriia bacterium]|nr:patatin-like phospholipase family protein [Terriglobia bacterium]
MGLLDFLTGSLRRPEGIVLALGGGGARGLAHVGVLEVIEEAGIPLAGIAGTSAGAVVAAMRLTMGGTAPVVERWRRFLEARIAPALPDIRLTETVSSRDNPIFQFARRIRNGAVVALALERTSLVSHEQLEGALAFLLPDVPIESLPLPFAAVATDFDTGDPVALRRGPLLVALAASCAIPAVVTPYTIGIRNLIDGGTVADVPVAQARLLAKRPVVAVEVGEGWPADGPATITLPRAMLRGANMTHRALRERLLRDADLVVSPDVRGAHWSEFGRFEELRAAGRAAAERAVHRMRALALRSSRKAGGSEEA